MEVLLSTCIFWALFSPVALLKCLQCVGSAEDCRKNPTESDCGYNENACITCTMNSRILNNDNAYVLKGCIQSQHCLPGSFSGAVADGLYVLGNVQCCHHDNCNTDILPVPSHTNFVPNGLHCPACFSLFSDNCTSQDNVSCMDLETNCFSMGSIVQSGSLQTSVLDIEINMALEGCGTPSFCSFTPGNSELFGGLLHVNITHSQCQAAQPYSILPNNTSSSRSSSTSQTTGKSTSSPTSVTPKRYTSGTTSSCPETNIIILFSYFLLWFSF